MHYPYISTIMQLKRLEYLQQSSFASKQTVYTTADPHPGSDRLFAKGRRLLVSWMTTTRRQMLSVGQLYTGARVFSNSNNWSRPPAASASVQRGDVITMWRCLLWQHGCHDYISTPAVVVISIGMLCPACP